jgi:hypothetical protein
LAALCCVLTLQSCRNTPGGPPPIDPAFVEHVSGFTSGIISNAATIRIQFTRPIGSADTVAAPQGLFSFSPDIEGTTHWVDARTIEFRPAARLRAGQVYDGVFHIGKVMELPEKLREFPFQVQVMDQFISVSTDPLRPLAPTDMHWYRLEGTVQLADVADTAQVRQTVTAKALPNGARMRWQHTDGTSHRFVVDSIARGEKAFELALQWTGGPVGVDLSGEALVRVPAFGEFAVTDVRAVQYPQQEVRISFSDPLQEAQDLRGLASIRGQESATPAVEVNEVVLRPGSRLSGDVTVDVRKGIRNLMGYALPTDHTATVRFSEIDPQIRLIGNGVIIPQSDGLLFPFEAVNLHAVQVKVTRIYEDNVAQFLQVNDLSGAYELRRVGKTVFDRAVPLKSERPIDRGQWNRFSLRLDELIKTEPGAIYRVELSMRKEFSALKCMQGGLTPLTYNEEGNEDEEENDYGYYDDYYYYEDEYEWNEREDPCKPSYYMGHRSKVARNVLASDLGIIAKADATGGLHVVVSDLRTASPLSRVKLDVLDYQQQVIGSGSTDGDGMLKLEPKGRPYLLVARNGAQRGYLVVDRGAALSVSMFEVDGQTTKKGLKGYIYGERSVWRPGDTLFLSFMLFDREQVLPPDHPVVFELHDSKGNLHTRTVRTNGVNGLYDFRTPTRTEDPTGNWTATVRTGGSEFSRTVKIETIKPNRLKINMQPAAKVLTAASGQKLTLDVKWLHGAVAKGMKASVDMTLVEAPDPFPTYKGYTFTDPTRYFYSEENRVFDGKCDEGGRATFDLGIQVVNEAPGMLMAGLSAKVFEPGGDFSIDRNKVLYSPYTGYVGFKVPAGKGWRGSLSSNEQHIIPVVTLDPEGRPLSRTGVQVEVFRLDWRWWWEGDDDGLSRYVNNASAYRIGQHEVNTINGKGTFTLKTEQNFWGRILVRMTDPETGHSAAQVVRMTYDGWLANMGEEGAKGATMLMFDLEKDTFKVGGEVRFSIPSAKGGRALLSLENGSSVVDLRWIDLKDGQTPISFKVTKDMAPTVYAHVSLVQPHGQTVNDRPIRMYGIQPVAVQDPATVLKPVITMPAELRPEQSFDLTVSEATGQAMTYTVAVVDEGLLDLTRHKTPDPHAHFYAKDALGVRTWDMYDLVLGAKAGELAGLLAIGGDEYNRPKGGKKADRFKPVVRHLGPFTLAAGKKVTHKITLPNYVGSVRAMVVAGQDLAYGNAEKAVPVRKPLMVLTSLPRVLGPGETVKLPVTLFAMDAKVKRAEVKVEVSGPIQIQGSATRTVEFKAIGEEMAYFDLIIPETIGKATVKVTATSGSERAEDRTELEVRLGNLPVREVVGAVIEPGQEAELLIVPPGMSGTNRAFLEVSDMPAIDLRKRLGYLISYPHGCIEQTTSAAFPQLALDRITSLTEQEKSAITVNVKAALNRLRSFIVPEGAFAYWPGQTDVSYWGTSYAGHFMLEAKAMGYTLPHGMLEGWIKAQAAIARRADGANNIDQYPGAELDMAYRLYTLALAGAPEIGSMNRLLERGLRDPDAAMRLAAAYQLAGRADIAARLVDSNLNRKTATATSPFDGTYRSPERDMAMTLETLVLMKRQKEAFLLMQDLAKKLGSDTWYSTQTTACALLAISKYAGAAPKGQLRYSYTASNAKKGDLSTDQMLSVTDLNMKGKETIRVKVRNNGPRPLYARGVVQGIPVTGDAVARQSQMDMTVRYTDLSGNPIDPGTLRQGTDFMAEVTVRHPSTRDRYSDLALSQVFPSGWEIVNMRLTDDAGPATSPFTFQDIRDDRVYTYFNLAKGATVTYRTLLNATYAGRYFLPQVSCEAMYDNEVQARLPGRWVTVE